MLTFACDGAMANLVAMMGTPRHAKQAVLTVADLLEAVPEAVELAVNAGALPRAVMLLSGELAGMAVRTLYYIAEGARGGGGVVACVCVHARGCACVCVRCWYVCVFICARACCMAANMGLTPLRVVQRVLAAAMQ